MSTLAEFNAAAKAYGNIRRARATKEAQYQTAYAQLQTLQAQEEAARVALLAAAEGLASDIP